MPLTVSLLCMTSVTVAGLYQMPLLRIESEMSQMMRAGTWATFNREIDKRRLDITERLSDNGLHSQNISIFKLTDYYESEYLGNVTIGTPEQSFQVLISTGSADFWVVDFTCAADTPEVCDESICDAGLICEVFCPNNSCCKNKKRKPTQRKRSPCRGKSFFDSRRSNTYKKEHERWSAEYEIGNAKGFYGNDTVRLGSVGRDQLVIEGTKFGQADSISEAFGGSRIDGVLGLAFHTLAFRFNRPPFQYAVELGLVDPVFTVYLERAGEKAEGTFGGVITYGGLDTKHCGDVILYEKITVARYWQFKMKSVSAGGYKSMVGWQVISDTSTSTIYAPRAIANGLAKAVNAMYNRDEDLFIIDCNERPHMTVGIGNEYFNIEAMNLVRKVQENKCIFAVHPDSTMGYSPSWILGAPFIRQYCHIYDMGKKQIGFAERLQK